MPKWIDDSTTTYFLVLTEKLGRDRELHRMKVWVSEHEYATTSVLSLLQTVKTVRQKRQFGNWCQYRVLAQGIVAGYSEGGSHVGQ
jgi:hypothetical protein